MRSTSPSSSQFPGRLTEGTVELPGRSHALHSRHVSQIISSIILSRELSSPTLPRVSLILGSFA
eukprot:3615679-Pyramimonas_sp.AAC.1